MTAEYVDLMKRTFAAFNRRDFEAISEFIDPNIEFVPIIAALEGRVYHGHEGIRRFWEELDRDWEVFEVRPEEYIDLGDRVLALGTWRARGRGSGVELDSQPAAWLVDFRDGMAIRFQTFTDRVKAFRAAGLEGEPGAAKDS